MLRAVVTLALGCAVASHQPLSIGHVYVILALGSAIGSQPLRIGHFYDTYSRLSTQVVANTLSARGHSVELVLANHPTTFGRFFDGQIDLLPATWMPFGHSSFVPPDKVLGKDYSEIGTLFEDASFFWVASESCGIAAI